jgi:hypothetical protein
VRQHRCTSETEQFGHTPDRSRSAAFPARRRSHPSPGREDYAIRSTCLPGYGLRLGRADGGAVFQPGGLTGQQPLGDVGDERGDPMPVRVSELQLSARVGTFGAQDRQQPWYPWSSTQPQPSGDLHSKGYGRRLLSARGRRGDDRIPAFRGQDEGRSLQGRSSRVVDGRAGAIR